MSAGTSSTVLRGLQPDTLYTVSLVPVYPEGDGKIMSENGKTSKTQLEPTVLLNHFLQDNFLHIYKLITWRS